MGGTLAGLVVIALVAGANALRTRKRLARLELLIRQSRDIALAGMSFVPVDAHWQPFVDGLEIPAGMQPLGDFVECAYGREPAGARRGFTDPAVTLYGWLARGGPTKAMVMVLVPATATDVYLTRLTPAAGGLLAAPPWAHREAVAYARGIAGALERHRERSAGVTGAVQDTAVAALQAELVRVRAMTIAWRQAQPPAALLDADLRSMLGPHYDRIGPRLAKQRALEMP